MKYLKLFENTNSRVGKKRLLPFRVDSILDQIELYEVANKIYAVKVKDPNIRAYLFLRYQEYYESPSKEFKSRNFDISEYIDWYMNVTKHKDLFTYSSDWAGFNLPSSSLEECLSGIRDMNEYDRIMSIIVAEIRGNQPDGNFYLLGVDDVDSDLMEHEVSHGFYFTDVEYRSKMDFLTKSLPKDLYNLLKDEISSTGYDDSVIEDEIQAYMATGLLDSMEDIPMIEEYMPQYREIFQDAFDKNLNIKKMDID